MGKYHENILTANADGVFTAGLVPDFLEGVGLNDAEKGKIQPCEHPHPLVLPEEGEEGMGWW